MTIHRRALVRATFAAAGAATVGLALATAVAAHVTIRPDSTASGSYSKITVRVPNESDTAGTTQVRLDLPADTPFASVRVQPRPGWTAELTRDDEAVAAVTWTAESGTRIGPDEFDEFAISVGPLPEPGTYLFPATQTYDDGTIVEWDMEPSGNEEPERPAPELTVTEAEDEPAAGSHGHDAPADEADADDADALARGVGIGGVAIGAAGLGIGAAALRRRRA